MKRDLGLCLWTLGPIDFEEKCKIASDLGVDGVEVQGELSQSPKELKKILDNYNLRVLSVTPENLDISSTDKTTRQAAVDYFIKLMPWAKEVGAERICLHGDVGKTHGCGDSNKDWELLVLSSKRILEEATKFNMPVVYEVLNRYENHQIITAKEALKLIAEVGNPLLTVLLDAYHMNIEESDPIAALKVTGDKLGVYHIADSNREGIGYGHSDLKGQLAMLDEINYQGPIIMEMTATGPNPFTPVKEGDYLSNIVGYYRESLEILTSLN